MALKIKVEHFAAMEAACKAVLSAHPNAREEYRNAGKSAQRFRWDVFCAAKIGGNSTRWLCDHLYPYLNDAHVDSALRKIVGE